MTEVYIALHAAEMGAGDAVALAVAVDIPKNDATTAITGRAVMFMRRTVALDQFWLLFIRGVYLTHIYSQDGISLLWFAFMSNESIFAYEFWSALPYIRTQ